MNGNPKKYLLVINKMLHWSKEDLVSYALIKMNDQDVEDIYALIKMNDQDVEKNLWNKYKQEIKEDDEE